MKLSELIKELQKIEMEVDQDPEVHLAHFMITRPFEYAVGGVTISNSVGNTIVYVCEGAQLNELSSAEARVTLRKARA